MKADQIDSILKEQAELKGCYDPLPDIEEITDPDNEDIKKAEEFTRSILSEIPSGEVDQMGTICHVINQLFENENQQCLFFDSSQGVNLYNTFGNLTDLSFEYLPFILKLDDIHGFDNEENRDDPEQDLNVVATLDRVVQNNQSHPVLEQIIERLAIAHDTDKSNIIIKKVYLGSLNLVYLVANSKQNTIEDLQELPKRIKAQFKQPVSIKMHPLMHRPTFDVASFDTRGDKNFEHEAGKFPVGPVGRTKEYIQPTG